jgi:hypothetical protein
MDAECLFAQTDMIYVNLVFNNLKEQCAVRNAKFALHMIAMVNPHAIDL